MILAAGASRRMGQPKGLLDYHGTPFLLYQIKQLRALGLKRIIIILGYDAQTYLESIPELENYTPILNPTPQNGQFSSVQCGLRHILSSPEPAKGVFILPVDVPCPNENVWKQLTEPLLKLGYHIVVPEYQGKRGHPVLLSYDILSSLVTLDPLNTRLDREIKKLDRKGKVSFVRVNDSKVLLNINTVEDWNNYLVRK